MNGNFFGSGTLTTKLHAYERGDSFRFSHMAKTWMMNEKSEVGISASVVHECFRWYLSGFKWGPLVAINSQTFSQLIE